MSNIFQTIKKIFLYKKIQRVKRKIITLSEYQRNLLTQINKSKKNDQLSELLDEANKVQTALNLAMIEEKRLQLKLS